MRFGITPLYINEDDILNTVTCLERILRQELWKKDKFTKKKAVT